MTDQPPLADDESARLQALAELAILDTPPEERFDRVTRLATTLFDVPMAMVTLIDRDRQWVKSATGADRLETRRGDAFCNTTITQPSALVVEDAHVDVRFAENPYVVGDPHIRFYAGHPLEVRGGHRVGALCLLDDKPRTITPDQLSLLGDLARWVQQELEVDEELERAAQVQRSLLPREAPHLDGYDLAGVCIPSRSVAGDFYDWYATPNGVVWTLADVMGKGIGGAILMATVRAVLRGASRTGDIADALVTAAAALDDDLDGSDSFVTVFHACVEPGSGQLRYVDAGHGLATVVRRDGSVEPVAAGGLPLGALPGTTWSQSVLLLDPGDWLVVATDGLIDRPGSAAGRAELEAARREIACAAHSATTAEELLASLVPRTPAPDDDITAIALRRCP